MADDLLSTYLNAPPVAPPPMAAVAGGKADLLSSYLPPTGAGTYPLGDPRNQGMLPNSYKDGSVTPNPVSDTVDPYDPISKQIANAARATGNYIKGQVTGIPGAIATEFNAAKDMAGRGISDIGARHWLPSASTAPAAPTQMIDRGETDLFGRPVMHSTAQFPHNVNMDAGGLAKMAGGGVGMIGSPVAGVADKMVQEPVTQGTGNPLAGQIAGMGASAAVMNALPKVMAGAPADAETLRLARVMDENGVPIRASQISTSPFVNKLDQAFGWFPGSGRAPEAAAQQGAFTKAVSNTFGEDTSQITRATVNAAKSRIGGIMNDVESRTPIQFDAPLINSLMKAQDDAKTMFGAGSERYRIVQNQIAQIGSLALHHGGNIPGDAWATLYHRGSPLDRLEGAADPDIGRIAGALKGAARDAVQRQAAPEDAAAYTNARTEYRNLKTVEPLVTTGTPGDISPAGLNQKVRANFDTTHAGPLGDLADAGQRFLRQPRDSGTPIGEAAIAAIKAPATMLSALAGAGGGLANYFSASTPGMVAAGLGAPVVTSAIARMGSALLNNPIYRNALLRGPDAQTSSMAKELLLGSVPNMPTGQPNQPR